MSFEFEYKAELDKSGLKALEKHVRGINKRHIRFGWIDGKQYPASHQNAGIAIAQVASWQEYGLSATGNRPALPSRPYFRQTVGIVKTKYYKDIASIFGTAIKGRNTASRLTKMSDSIEKDYRESVLRQNYKKLAPYTVSLKNHTYQMFDTGVMMDGFKSKVYRQSQSSIKE